MRLKKNLILVIISLVISSCCTVSYVPQDLTGKLPPKLVGDQVLTQEELSCITDKTLDKIILLDKRRKTLRGIIESTKK
jgi:hypothetical protein